MDSRPFDRGSQSGSVLSLWKSFPQGVNSVKWWRNANLITSGFKKKQKKNTGAHRRAGKMLPFDRIDPQPLKQFLNRKKKKTTNQAWGYSLKYFSGFVIELY